MRFNNTLKKIIKANLETNAVPMLLGEPGIGKSSWVESLAKDMYTKCFTLPCNQLADKADLTGTRLVPITSNDPDIATDYKQESFPHAIVHNAIEYALENPKETPILFLDELNRTSADVTSEALSIPTSRSLGNKKLPNNLKIITAGNDKGNVTALDTASTTRFILYTVAPDTETFLGLDPDLNPFIRTVLEKNPDTIFCKPNASSLYATNLNNDDDDDSADEAEGTYIEDILDESDEMLQLTTPRTISALSKWLNLFDNTDLSEFLQATSEFNSEKPILQEVIEGHVGRTRFSELLLKQIAENLMSVDNQTNALSISMPNEYDVMKSLKSVDEVLDFIDNLSENQLSAYIVYALYEKEDNDVYITHLAPNVKALQPNDVKNLMNLSANDKLDQANARTLANLDTALSKNLAIVLSSI